jgi:hypothetical protein
MDLHGNHLGQTGGIGYEVYRNTIPATSIVNTMQFVDIRGGKSIMFDNAITYSSGAVSARFREEEDDDTGPPPGFTVNPINGQPQHVWDTYFWNNTYNGTILVPSLSNECGACSICGHTVPTANLDIWLHNALFNGTSGVGRGLLSAMPATCTNGSAYWATDQGNWNQSTAGMQGYGTGSGVLYKCSSANSTPGTFSAYYTPYTYPHPLRGEGTTPPSATGCTISGATFK